MLAALTASAKMKPMFIPGSAAVDSRVTDRRGQLRHGPRGPAKRLKHEANSNVFERSESDVRRTRIQILSSAGSVATACSLSEGRSPHHELSSDNTDRFLDEPLDLCVLSPRAIDMLANLVRLAGRSSTWNPTRGNLTSVAAGRGRTDSVVALVRCVSPHLPQLLADSILAAW